MGEGKNSVADIAFAHAQLAARQLADAAYGPALESIATALRLAPGVAAFWSQFSELIRFFNFRHPVDPWLRELLAAALQHPAVDPGDLVRPITSIALSHPQGALAEPLLARMLEDVVIRDASLERLIAASRRTLLDQVFGEPPLALPTMVAIAQQCFNTEYVFQETEEERQKLERLREAIETAKPAPLHWYAVYAAYRPLLTLQGVENLAATPLALLAQRQIVEPLEERRLRASIPALSGEARGVSAAVRAQYEANPYPRWLRTQSGFAPGPLAQILRELFPLADLEGITQAAPRILVAGCGTGQNSIATAQRFLGASVLAVDLSLASLAYARRKTLELGLANIEYRQADILGLETLAQRFDLIECSGVLHHLEDPLAGWRVLASLLEPRGLMRVGLYSEAGRRHVARARELIAAGGFEPTPEGIRACRAALLARQDDEALARIACNEDFFSLSGCRDLLFHAHERRFDLAEVAAMIARLGMTFIGFEFPDSGATAARYRARFPQDPRLADLGNWQRLEQDYPDSFARMYQFWVRAAG